MPKPFDPRVIEYEAVAVAKAACEDGVASAPITDWDAYRESLKKRMEKDWDAYRESLKKRMEKYWK